MSESTPTVADVLRELLYGDAPLQRWAEGNSVFRSVRDALVAGDEVSARARLVELVGTPGLESLDYLQAWHELRALGVVPADPAFVHGVVIDMPMSDGLDTLAAYDDGSCRYLNQSGKVLVWQSEDAEVARLARTVLDQAAAIAAQIGPWDGPRPALRPAMARISMLCRGGLYFGEGPASALSADPLAGPLIAAGAHLLDALIRRAVPHG